MAAVPGGGLVSIPSMAPITMAAAAAAAAGISPQQLQPQISTMMQAGTPMSTMFTGSASMPSIITTMAAAAAAQQPYSIVTSGVTTNSLVSSVQASDMSNNIINGTNDGQCSNLSMSPSRSQSSGSPPILSGGCNMSTGGGRGTPTSGIGSGVSISADEEKDNAAFLKELMAEKDSLELTSDETILKSNTIKLLEQEISRLQAGGSRGAGFKDPIKYVDVYRERPIRLTVRVLVPVREHPKFNFVGKLLGPKGNSMKRLQEETMTKMAVLGRGSMRDKQKEEELRASNDPKYQHLQEELHVEITAFAPPAEAHARIAYALTEVRKYLIPDSNDEIRQEQMREMEILTTNIDGISAAALAAAAGSQSVNGGAQDVLKSGVSGPNSTSVGVGASAQQSSSPYGGNLLSAAIHPALRPATANTANSLAALASPQSIQSFATSPLFRAGLPQNGTAGLPTSLLAAAVIRPNSVGYNGQQQPQALLGSQYTIAASPMVRSKMLTTPTSVQQQEVLLEAAAVSQAKEDSLGGSTGENDLWQGLKAPSTYHDQRSKFRQQASPYVRPT